MTPEQDRGRRFRAAYQNIKNKRNQLDKVMMHVIADTRADAALIELRKALDELDLIVGELPA